MTTTTTIPLTELLSLNYLFNYTILYEHESPPPSSSSINTLKTNNNSSEELVQLKLKSLNATKLSLLIVKAIANHDNSTTVNNDTADNTASINMDEFKEVDNTNNGNIKSAYQINNFHIKLKLPNSTNTSISNGGSNGVDKDCNTNNYIVLLGAEIIPPSTDEVTADEANAGEALSDDKPLQSIGYILHSIYKSDSNDDNEYDNIEPIPLTVNSNGILSGSNIGSSNGYPNQQLRLVSNCDITRDSVSSNGSSIIMGNGISNVSMSNSSSSREDKIRSFKMRRSSQDFTLFTSLGKFFYCLLLFGTVEKGVSLGDFL